MEYLVILLLIGSALLGLSMLWVYRENILQLVSNPKANRRTIEEDLLKYMYLLEANDQEVSLNKFEEETNYTDDQVRWVVPRLLDESLIEEEGGRFHLTRSGRQAAIKILRAHRLWERFLADHTGFPDTEWHSQAETHEHRLSDDEVERLAAQLGYPAYDPHGDPIPTASGDLPYEPGQPVSELPAGTAVRIVHLEDEPESIYQRLRQLKLSLGSELYLLESSEGRTVIWLDGDEIALRSSESANVFVTPIPEWDFRGRLAGERLSSLQPGEVATVHRISPVIRGPERRRLMDLGIVPGTTISSEFSSPNGEPVAFGVRGALIALRRDQADHIHIHRSAA